MPILNVELKQTAANFLHPTSMRNASRIIDEVVSATVKMAGVMSRQGRQAKEILAIRSMLALDDNYKGDSLKCQIVINGPISNGIFEAIGRIQTSCSAEALQDIQSADKMRKNLAAINRALGGTDYTLKLTFAKITAVLSDLALATHASIDVPWEGEVVLVPDQWHSGSRQVIGSGMDMRLITLNLAHDPDVYAALMPKNPAAIRFLGRGHRNNRVLRVIAETPPEVVDPAEALGELRLQQSLPQGTPAGASPNRESN